MSMHFFHPTVGSHWLPDTNLDPMIWLNALPYYKPRFRFHWTSNRWLVVGWMEVIMPVKVIWSDGTTTIP